MQVRQLKDINRGMINELVEATVLLVEVKIKTAKNDKRYGDMIIQDTTKIMEVKYWDYEENKEYMDTLELPEIIHIRALVGEYQGQVQLTIKDLERADQSKIRIEDLLPYSTWDLESMKSGLNFFYGKIRSPHLKILVEKMIFSQPYFEKFSTYPAARQVHHNFYRGLLQHTLEVLKFAYTVATTKKLSERQIERLIVMALLHDWAKIMEYKALPNIGFTEEGTMLGHIFLGAHTTLNMMDEIENFDEGDKLIILNGILSHHGKLEYGSPVLPKTVEAQILHQADKMSGDVESILSFIEEQEQEEEIFTPKLWNMGTEYYKKFIK